MVIALDDRVSVCNHADDDCSEPTLSSFRAKVAQMKNWKPNSTPSGREKLELYALHKQVISNDAPSQSQHQSLDCSTTKISHLMSPAELAKLNAWKTKRGLSRSEAMTRYILEADRQMLVYGTAPTTTPRNTPQLHTNGSLSNKDEDSCYSQKIKASTFITPRGLAVVPLLCAVASETRHAYLQRLGSKTNANTPNSHFSDGWWRKQEPLCGDPGTILALPETALIVIATALESFSLSLNGIAPKNTTSTRKTRKKLLTKNHQRTIALAKDNSSESTVSLSSAFVPANLLPTTMVQSFLWPLHNILLIIWILIIFLSTAAGTAIIALRTMYFGRKVTGTSLEEIFVQEIQPLKEGVLGLCATHQGVGVRLLGLALYPMGLVCELTASCRERCVGSGSSRNDGNCVRDEFGIYVALGVYTSVVTTTWWYWFVVLPWIATGGIFVSLGLGWCFALVDDSSEVSTMKIERNFLSSLRSDSNIQLPSQLEAKEESKLLLSNVNNLIGDNENNQQISYEHIDNDESIQSVSSSKSQLANEDAFLSSLSNPIIITVNDEKLEVKEIPNVFPSLSKGLTGNTVNDKSIPDEDGDNEVSKEIVLSGENATADEVLLSSCSLLMTKTVNDELISNESNNDESNKLVLSRKSQEANNEDLVIDDCTIDESMAKGELSSSTILLASSPAVENISTTTKNEGNMNSANVPSDTTQVPLQNTSLPVPLVVQHSVEQKMMDSFISVTDTFFVPDENASTLERLDEPKPTFFLSLFSSCLSAKEQKKDGLLG